VEQRFWVFDWFEQNRIHKSIDIDRFLGSPILYSRFRQAAQQAREMTIEPITNNPTVLAGSGLDFSGSSCAERSCIAGEAEFLLRRTWHYFDSVIVSDLTHEIVLYPHDKADLGKLGGWLDALLIAKNADAENLLKLSSKSIFCSGDCAHAATDLDFPSSNNALPSDRLTETLLKESKIRNGKRSGKTHRYLEFESEKFKIYEGFLMKDNWIKTKNPRGIHQELTRIVVDQGLCTTSTNLYLAKKTDATIASLDPTESFLLRYAASPEGNLTNQVAFNIELPFIDEVPLKKLYELREDFEDSFKLYQSTLRKAIHERVKTIEDPQCEKISREIYEDVISPSLEGLRTHLNRNFATLFRDFSGAALGATLGIVGLVTHEPILAGSGFALSTGLTVSGLNALKDRDALGAADTFLLYTAQNYDHE
jgi:hypothetical protein